MRSPSAVSGTARAWRPSAARTATRMKTSKCEKAIVGATDAEAALRERGGKAAAGVAVDGTGQAFEDDQEPDGDDDGVQLGLAVQRPDQDALARRPDGESDDEHERRRPTSTRGRGPSRLNAMNVVSMPAAPWAKLMIRVAR